MESLGKKTGTTDASITNRIQEIKERIRGVEDTIEYIDTIVKENAKCKMQKAPNPKYPGNPGHNEKNQRIIGLEESKDSKLKGPVNIFNKIVEENFPNLKKEMPMNIQDLQIEWARKEIPPIT